MRMNLYDNMFKKANIQNLSAFITSELHEYKDISNEGNYSEKIENAENAIYEMVTKNFPNSEEENKLHGQLNDAFDANREVYFEIGLKVGARLVAQLLND